MTLETMVALLCAVVAVASGIVYLYGRENVYLKYKEQRIPPIHTKKSRPGSATTGSGNKWERPQRSHYNKHPKKLQG